MKPKNAGVREDLAGLGLAEVMVAVLILTVGLGGMGSLLIAQTNLREALESRTAVRIEAENLMEEIVSAIPSAVQSTYDGTTYPVSGIVGNHGDGSVLSVSASYAETKLLVVTVTASWLDKDIPKTFDIYTEVYDPKG